MDGTAAVRGEGGNSSRLTMVAGVAIWSAPWSWDLIFGGDTTLDAGVGVLAEEESRWIVEVSVTASLEDGEAAEGEDAVWPRLPAGERGTD